MNVLMVSTYFHPIASGAERQARALAGELLRRGHSVSVATCRVAGAAREEVVGGIRIHRVITPVGRGPVYAFSYVASLLRFLIRSRHRYDLIHAQLLFLDAVAAAQLRIHGRMPALAKAACGGSFGDVARLRQVAGGQAMLRQLYAFDGIVAPSRQVEDGLVGAGFQRARVVRIPNGVDADRFCPTTDRQRAKQSLGLQGTIVTFVGRLDPQKGLPALLEGWRTVAESVAEAQLLVIGAGPEEGAAKRLAAQQGIAARVRFLGAQREVLPYLQASDAFVLPSLAEGMSNALLEAMACGLPCVASRIGGNEELIAHGVNGLLVQPGAPTALARALRSVLEDPGQASEMGTRARQTVQDRFAMGAVAERYLALYERLLHPGQGHEEAFEPSMVST